jgi:hypothetical protein
MMNVLVRLIRAVFVLVALVACRRAGDSVHADPVASAKPTAATAAGFDANNADALLDAPTHVASAAAAPADAGPTNLPTSCEEWFDPLRTKHPPNSSFPHPVKPSRALDLAHAWLRGHKVDAAISTDVGCPMQRCTAPDDCSFVFQVIDPKTTATSVNLFKLQVDAETGKVTRRF